MRKLFFILSVITIFALTSCAPQRIIYRESSGRNIEPTQGAVFTPAMVADLHIMTDKSVKNVVTFNDVIVTTAILGEIENFKKIALFQTIQKYNADIMVASMINVNTNGRGQLEITVVGYPARYTNFRPISQKDSISMKYTDEVLLRAPKPQAENSINLGLNLFKKK